MRKNQPEIQKTKESVLNFINEKSPIKKIKNMGRNIYQVLENDALFDLSYASLNSRNEYFFGIEKEQLDKLY